MSEKKPNDKKSSLSKDEERQLFLLVHKADAAKRRLAEDNMLSDSERISLKEIIAAGRKAQNRIFEANSFLIKEIKSYYWDEKTYSLEDAEQDAAVKIIECIRKYDVDNPASFSTYCRKCITGCVIDARASNVSLLIPNKSFIKRLWKVKRFITDYVRDHGNIPTNEEITKGTGLKERALTNLTFYNYKVVSLNGGINNQDTNFTPSMEYCGTIDDSSINTISPIDQEVCGYSDSLCESIAIWNETAEKLSGILDKYCSALEKNIINMRFGFHSEPLTDDAIAEILDMDVNEVRLIWALVLLKLEDPCKKKGLNDIYK